MSSVIRSWLSTNTCNHRIVNRSEHIQRTTEVSPAANLEAAILGITNEISLKVVEAALENLIGSERKRAEGSVYTPNYVIDYIIGRCVEIRSAIVRPTLVDPACGSGGFLIRAIPLLSQKCNISNEQVINELIYGIDVSCAAIECTKLAIELFCAKSSTELPSDFSFLHRSDTLLSSKEQVVDAFGVDDDGFDIVVTNPPFVKLQNLDENYRLLLTEAYPEFTSGSFSLAMLFLVAGYRLLSQSGVLGYITQNNVYTSLAGERLREFLQDKKCLHTIVDFGHKKVFPENSAYTCLMFLDRTPQEALRFKRCSQPEDELPELQAADFHPVAINGLDKKKWRLAPEHHLRNIQQLETNGTPLGELAHIRVGFATLKDSVFLIDGGLGNSKIEEEVTKPAIKIADFSDEEGLRKNEARVIQPYKKIRGRWLSIEEDEFRLRYPNAYAHLKLHEVELGRRDKGRKPPRRFYEWGRSQCMEAQGPKLLTKTFNRGPNFLLDESDSLFCNGYSVEIRKPQAQCLPPLDLRVLQRILNSWVMDYYAKLTSFQIEGGYQCFQKNFIERFCVPEVTSNVAENIIRLNDLDLNEYVCDLFDLPLDEILQVVAGLDK